MKSTGLVTTSNFRCSFPKTKRLRRINTAAPSESDRLAESLSRRLSELDVEEAAPQGHVFEAEVATASEKTRPVTAETFEAFGSGGYTDPTAIPDECLPKVAIVGRPNVGKSALFNRFSKTSTAIVYDKPGVTRDRLFVRAFWGNKEFTLIDTGGLPDARHVDGVFPEGDVEQDEEIPIGVEIQVAMAVEEADGVVMVVDGQVGLTGSDQEIMDWLRTQHSDKPLVLAVNKCENYRSADEMASGFWELGIEPFPVSAISGLGTGDLLDALVPNLPPPKPVTEENDKEAITTVAILGRPNTGKSSLLNLLVGEDRSIVSRVAGTTRDAVDAEFSLPGGQKVKVVDTAGVRRRMAVYGSKDKVEPMMVEHAMRAMRQANVVVLMVDCEEGVTQQDFRLSLLAAEEGCAVVVVANKFDLVENGDREEVRENVRAELREVGWAQVVVTSVRDENPVKAITRAILAADRAHQRRITTATFNMVIRDAVNWRPPPAGKNGRKARIYYATQPSARPPTFVLFVNDTNMFSDDYKRYLKKQLRENIGFNGTPIHLVFRGKPSRAVGELR
ncbi:hypothetical protein BSKO_04669 [Bryopsis sp. KO-2023]|nr:hypothetical protein BSKO_04669 [Bryopsis sp. KO-2023]